MNRHDNTGYCPYARGGGYCLCSACESMRKALEEAEKIDSEQIFREAEEIFKEENANTIL